MVPNEWTPIGTWTSWSTVTSISYPDPWAWTATTSATTISYDAPWSWNVQTNYVELDRQWTVWQTHYQTPYQQDEETRERMRVAAERHRITQERLRAEREEERRVVEAERAEADKKAKELFMSLLTAKHKREILEHGWFEIIGKSGRRWRIRTEAGVSGNVDLMPLDPDDNERLASYCAHGPAGEYLPKWDHLLLQKLTLESDDEAFTRVAYQSWARPNLTDEERALLPARLTGLRPVA